MYMCISFYNYVLFIVMSTYINGFRIYIYIYIYIYLTFKYTHQYHITLSGRKPTYILLVIMYYPNKNISFNVYNVALKTILIYYNLNANGYK